MKIKHMVKVDVENSAVYLVKAIIAAVVVFASCGENKQPQKTKEQIVADSIAKAKQDSIERPKKFKERCLKELTRFLKNCASSDPSVGEVLMSDDLTLTDSIYLSKLKVLVANKFGAKMQRPNFWILMCLSEDGKMYLCPYPSMEKCQSGLDYLTGDKGASALPLIGIIPEYQSKVKDKVCSNPYRELEWLMENL